MCAFVRGGTERKSVKMNSQESASSPTTESGTLLDKTITISSTQSILKPDRRKIVYRRNLKSHRFLPDNKLNLYCEGHQHAFYWLTARNGFKKYHYPARIPSASFTKMLKKNFGDRVRVEIRGSYMQLTFDNDTDYVMFGLTYLGK